MMKVGFGLDTEPRAVFRSVVGRPKNPGIMVGMGGRSHWCGDEAVAKQGILSINCPIKKGMIAAGQSQPLDHASYPAISSCYTTTERDREDVERLWHHTFYNELRVTPEEHLVLLSNSIMSPDSEKKWTLTTMFETFNVFGLQIQAQEELAVYGMSRNLSDHELTGATLSFGQDITRIVPVVDGHAIKEAIREFPVGGGTITDLLSGSLAGERGITLPKPLVRQMKESEVIYVSSNFHEEVLEEEALGLSELQYQLPDGSILPVQSERFRVAEILFQPQLPDYCGYLELLGDDQMMEGLPDLVSESIRSCDDAELRSRLFKNIVLCGGSTMLTGFAERLSSELQKLTEAVGEEIILRRPRASLQEEGEAKGPECDRSLLPWLGGALRCSLPTFRDKWITKEDYDDEGWSCILRKAI